ncbi:MAG: SIMPL domain-containing protein, partial [Minisyncoccales bacterium]
SKEGERIWKGYVLEQEFRLKIRDFEKIGLVIEKSTEKGANLIGNLYFTINDPESLREKAREIAIKRAKEKAKKIAKETGIKLKKIINVYEGYSSPLPAEKPIIGYREENFLNAPEIQPGEQEIRAEMNLVYLVD